VLLNIMVIIVMPVGVFFVLSWHFSVF